MKTSARNQFSGIVSRIQEGAVNAEVELTLDSGQQIIAMITRASVVRLGLQIGKPAFALVKASTVVLVTDIQGAVFSTRNMLDGTVAELRKGAVNSEVIIQLAEGGTVAAIVTNESATSLGLQPGAPVTAIFKTSSVIVGVIQS